jgi:hypothetical protein
MFTKLHMEPTVKRNRRVPATFVQDHKQHGRWLALLSPWLRHVNMRTLAFLMFVGFALLNTSHGKDAETKESAFTENTNVRMIDNDYHQAAERVTALPRHVRIVNPVAVHEQYR